MVTFKGNPLTLVGKEVEVGQKAPPFEVTSPELKPISLNDFHGKVLVISTVPSLDTAVCNLQGRRFEQEAAKHKDVQFITISLDLPFAQARWTKEAHCSHMPVFSDYKERFFGRHYGVLIQELQLLARAVFIIDKTGILRYKQIVSEMTEEPNYDDVFKALNALQQ